MSRLCSLVAPVFGCPSFVYFRGRLVTSLLSFYRLCYRYGGLGSSLLRIRHVFFWRVCPSLFLGCCRYFSAEPSLVDSRPWFWRFLVQVPCCLRVFAKSAAFCPVPKFTNRGKTHRGIHKRLKYFGLDSKRGAPSMASTLLVRHRYVPAEFVGTWLENIQNHPNCL